MAVTDALVPCPRCSQTIFADSSKCQFCGHALTASPSYACATSIQAPSTAANTWSGICGSLWLMFDALWLYGTITGGNDPRVRLQSAAFQAGNSFGKFMGFALALYLGFIAVGMISRAPWACKSAYWVAWLGTAVSLIMALLFLLAMTQMPFMIVPLVLALMMCALTFVTRWAVKNATV